MAPRSTSRSHPGSSGTLVAERRVPYLKVGKYVRFDADDLDRWLDTCRVDPTAS